MTRRAGGSRAGADQISNREARWLTIGAQGLGSPRRSPGAGRPGPATLRRLLDQVGTVQLDAVNVLERTQYLVPFSRIGPYDQAVLRGLTGPGGDWFEYWGHAASLLPIELYPLFRSRMESWRADQVDSPVVQERRRQWRKTHADYLAAVLDEVRERGPLTASKLSDPRRRGGAWWDRRSDGRRALEMLFGDGVLAAWRNPSFERVYDLSERVIPRSVSDLPAPSLDEAQRELILLAARCLGVATVADLADYFWIRPRPAALRVTELVEAGRLLPVEVEGWDKVAYVVPEARPRRPRRQHATLLSPFDSLIWARARTERLFGFHYRIGIYVPEHLRTHGYYVLPLLVGDELVARFDLKADRRSGTLSVVGSYAEPGTDPGAVVDAAAAELGLLRQWLGLEHTVVAARGNLAPRLRRTVAAEARTAPHPPNGGRRSSPAGTVSARTGASRRTPRPR
ncbi:MAG: crosslink repair DNA glycosylase YcaQ family protein [Acidimicrobiales bacterium]|jgi:uncharacterized protein YcaQ